MIDGGRGGGQPGGVGGEGKEGAGRNRKRREGGGKRQGPVWDPGEGGDGAADQCK